MTPEQQAVESALWRADAWRTSYEDHELFALALDHADELQRAAEERVVKT